jgi:hypothetical protein
VGPTTGLDYMEKRKFFCYVVLYYGVLRGIFGPKRDEVIGGWRKL